MIFPSFEHSHASGSFLHHSCIGGRERETQPKKLCRAEERSRFPAQSTRTLCFSARVSQATPFCRQPARLPARRPSMELGTTDCLQRRRSPRFPWAPPLPPRSFSIAPANEQLASLGAFFFLFRSEARHKCERCRRRRTARRKSSSSSKARQRVSGRFWNSFPERPQGARRTLETAPASEQPPLHAPCRKRARGRRRAGGREGEV